MTNSNIDPITRRAIEGDERETIDLDAGHNSGTGTEFGSDPDQRSDSADFGERDTLNDSFDADPGSAPRQSPGEGFEPGEGRAGVLEDSYSDVGTGFFPGGSNQPREAGYGFDGGSDPADLTGSSDQEVPLVGSYQQSAPYSSPDSGSEGGAKAKTKQVASQVGDQAGTVKDTVGQQASAVKDSVADKAVQVKDLAAQRAGDVAGVTKEELSKLVAEARGQVQTLWDQAAGQLREQAGTGQRQLAEMVHGLAGELGELTSKADSDGPVTSLLKQAAYQSGQFSHWLSEAHTDDVLSELRRFARRRPAVFLAGATLAGIVVGRLGRGLMAAAKTEQQTASLTQERGYYEAGTRGIQPTGYDVGGEASVAPGATMASTYYGDGADLDTTPASGIDPGYQGEFGDVAADRPGFTGGERR